MYDSKTVIEMHNKIIALLEERDRKAGIIKGYFRLCVSQGKTIEEQDKKLRAAERKIRKLEAEIKGKADFEEVVRCGECKHYGTSGCAMDAFSFDVTEESFCSYGERKDTDEH